MMLGSHRSLPAAAALLLALPTLWLGSAASADATSGTVGHISMTTAEKEVVSLFSIPSYYKLIQEYYDNNSGQAQSTYDFSFSYTTPDAQQRYVNATVSAETGTVESFSRDSQAVGFVYPVPVSATKAKTIALKWARRLYPDQLAHVRLLPLLPNQGALTAAVTYQFDFERTVNEIPAPFDGFSLTIDQNGRLIQANDHWTQTSFPSAQGVVSPSRVAQVYRDALHLYLAYTTEWSGYAGPLYEKAASAIHLTYQQPSDPYPEWWSTPFDSADVTGVPAIDASTGRVIDSSGKARVVSWFSAPTPLSPAGPTVYPGQTRVNWSQSQAQRYAFHLLRVSSAARLTDASQSQSFPSGDVTWNFTWEVGAGKTINASVDATRGILTNFDAESGTPENSQHPTQTQVNAAAAAFVRRLFPNDTGGMAVINPNQNQHAGSGQSLNTSFIVEPLLHGVPMIDRTGEVQINGKTGAVQSYWGNLAEDIKGLPLPTRAIPRAQADKLWLQDMPLQLTYLTPQTTTDTPGRVLLVYIPVGRLYGTNLNAVTGQFVNENPSPVPYAGSIHDLTGIPQADAVQLLVRYGLLQADEKGDVHPQQAMTRAGFVKLVVEALGLGAHPGPIVYDGTASAASATIAQQSTYSELQTAFKRGWIQSGKLLHPNDPITRGDAAQILARALGYAGVLNHANIFTIPATDAKTISQNEIGGDAIAYALGMLPLIDGKFASPAHVTVAQAALAIVRLVTAYNEGQQLFAGSQVAAGTTGVGTATASAIAAP